MTRIDSSGRLNELLRIVGTRPTEKKQSRKTTGKDKSAASEAKDLETLRQELSREISAIDMSAETGPETAQRVLIHKVILNRFGKIQPNAAQLSFLTQEVSRKALARPEVRELLSDVIDEVLAEN